MSSWLRALGLRVALLGALVVTLLATHLLVPRSNLPFVLLDSFEQAFTRVYDAAERRVVALEARPPPAPPHDVAALLGALGREIDAACDATATALDVELALSDALSPARRAAVRGCIERHLADARRCLTRASDPELRAEYARTCQRLRQIRDLV